ncbi:hypothetical protein GQ55_3G430300 [Panicum hallii var. hallii]|uniref:Uncharacterized protein n=1 Tax=Panicum hallii var. hallii TaxID=1504633 RepID=A0A2T7EHT2_9POAL|nr:hypothetical protein GQ55_3G430300 [Panicum hallii var. hallii]
MKGTKVVLTRKGIKGSTNAIFVQTMAITGTSARSAVRGPPNKKRKIIKSSQTSIVPFEDDEVPASSMSFPFRLSSKFVSEDFSSRVAECTRLILV